MTSIILVATLIADPAREPLTEATLDRAAKAVAGVDCRRWLAERGAADIMLIGELEPKRAAIEAAYAGEPSDVIVQPLAGREKKLPVADMDSTLIDQECLQGVASPARFG